MSYQLNNKNNFYSNCLMIIMLSLSSKINAEPLIKKLQTEQILKQVTVQKKSSPTVLTPIETVSKEDIVDVIVEEKPLEIPQAFIDTLKNMGVTGITLMDMEGKIRLLSVNGKYINPCYSESNQRETQNTNHTCKLEASLGETHRHISHAQNYPSNHHLLRYQSSCGTCQGGGVTRFCHKTTHKYACSSQTSSCNTSCN